jgi:hypothetical protein
MKLTQTGAAAALACAMAVTLGAQTPAPERQTPSSPSSSANKVTVTGCLEKASPSDSPTGTSGAAGASAAAKFVLNNASSGSAAPSGAAGTSGASATSYKLDGEDAKLTPHVGHKVEITGTAPASDRASSTGAAASAGAMLKVESIKMIAQSCTP